MGKPDADAVEIDAGAKALSQHPQYSAVIGEGQARNIAYTVLVAARGAKMHAAPRKAPGCRSAVQPCFHQRSDPFTICAVCRRG